MQRIRELLTIILLGLLPFHALLVTIGTKMMLGPGQAPMPMLALWKEVVLGIILLIACIEIVVSCQLSVARKTPRTENRQPRTDLIDWLIVSLIALSVVVTAATHGDWRLYLIGFKYDFVPLVAFVALRRVAWSDLFIERVYKVLLAVAVAVAVFGMIAMHISQEFFLWLGYSDLHSLYNPDSPLAAFQQIGGSSIRRMQSTMSGPNQLGLWLLLPFSIVLTCKKGVGSWGLVAGVFVLVAMFMSLSRSALLAAGVIVVVLLWKQFPRKRFFQFAGTLFCMSFVLLFAIQAFVPSVVSRSASTKDHISRPIEALQTIIKNPLGLGLGTAGPASNRTSDTCVHLEEGSDPLWAQTHPNLCVFVGGTQVQPVDGACSCPLLPENWYLQMGVEMGVLGFVLFVMLTILILRKLPKGSPVFLAFLGVSIAALFLHAWEDATVAYTVWILLGLFIPPPR